MDVHRRLIPLTAAVVVGLVACGDDQPATSPTAVPSTVAAPTTASTLAPGSTLPVDPTTTTIATAPTTTEAPMTTSSVPDGNPMVQQAIADLAERLAVEPNEIEVVSVEEVDWPDGSIGCPQPGMVYTQAIVNGSKIVLRYDGTDYAYHQGGSRPVFYCPPTSTVEK